MSCHNCECGADGVMYEIAKLVAEAAGCVLVPKRDIPPTSGPEADLRQHLMDVSEEAESMTDEQLRERWTAVYQRWINLSKRLSAVRAKAKQLNETALKQRNGPDLTYALDRWEPAGYASDLQWLLEEKRLLEDAIKERIIQEALKAIPLNTEPLPDGT